MKKYIFLIISILFFTCNAYAIRIIEPFTQYFDDNGDPLAYGKIYFYETGTTTLKNTYSNENLTSANTNPVVLDSSGRIGDVFGSGEYKAILKNSAGTTIDTFDPIGDLSVIGSYFENWSSTKSYGRGAIVYKTAPPNYYYSLASSNLNHDPTGAGYYDYWMLFRFGTDYWTTIASDKTTYGWPLECLNVNTSAGPITITLHSSPSPFDKVIIYDYDNNFETNNCTIQSEDGENINWVASSYVCDGSDFEDDKETRIELIYDLTNGWLLNSN